MSQSDLHYIGENLHVKQTPFRGSAPGDGLTPPGAETCRAHTNQTGKDGQGMGK